MNTTSEEQLSYEQAREELVALVARLEAGGITLEESLTLWERGETLAAYCQEQLTRVQGRLEAAKVGAQEAPPSPETQH